MSDAVRRVNTLCEIFNVLRQTEKKNTFGMTFRRNLCTACELNPFCAAHLQANRESRSMEANKIEPNDKLEMIFELLFFPNNHRFNCILYFVDSFSSQSSFPIESLRCRFLEKLNCSICLLARLQLFASFVTFIWFPHFYLSLE